MKNAVIIGLFCAVLCLHGSLRAQISDAGMWFEAEGEFRLNPFWMVEAAVELRMHENLMEVGAMIAEVGLQRNFGDRWRAAGGMRMTYNQQPDRTFDFRSRMYADIRYRYSYRQLDFTARVRYQQEAEGWLWDSATPQAGHYLRAGTECRWKMTPKWRPYLAIEAFYPLNGILMGPNTDKLRYRCGVEYRLNKVHALDVGFLFQQQINVTAPERDYIACLGYTFSPRW